MMPSANTPAVRCGACGGFQTATAFAKNGFQIRSCRTCDFKFVHPPPADDPARLYGQGYFCGAEQGFGYVHYEEDKIAMRPFFERVLALLGELKGRPGALLDVGAATGFFLKLAAAHGWTGQGVEVSDFACRRAKAAGLAVQCGTLEAAAFPAVSFDAVTLLDVIEHVSSPAHTLVECRRILKPGGMIFVNTPDTASAWARLFGQHWHAYCPPEHLAYFNQKNLGRLLERSGFRVGRSGKIGKSFTPAYVASMLYRWQGLRIWGWLSKYLERPRLNRLALPIDVRDNFFIAAEKV